MGGGEGGTSGKLQLSSIETLPVHQNFSCQKSQLERSKLDKNEQINQQIVKAEQGNSRKKLKPVKLKSTLNSQVVAKNVTSESVGTPGQGDDRCVL